MCANLNAASEAVTDGVREGNSPWFWTAGAPLYCSKTLSTTSTPNDCRHAPWSSWIIPPMFRPGSRLSVSSKFDTAKDATARPSWLTSLRALSGPLPLLVRVLPGLTLLRRVHLESSAGVRASKDRNMFCVATPAGRVGASILTEQHHTQVKGKKVDWKI